MKRGFLFFIASVLIIASVSVGVYANEKAEIIKQAPDIYLKSNLEETNELKNKVETHYKSISTYEITGEKRLSVSNIKQMNGYYCGPASTRMVLKYLGKDISQSDLGKYMSTSKSEGTYVYKIVNALNHYLGKTKYKYVLESQVPFGEGLIYSIDKNRPIICQVMTKSLPNYSKTGHNTSHYIVATGYKYKALGNTGSDTVYYNDPNNDSDYYGKYNTTWSNMRKSINAKAGFFIMSI